MLLLERDTQQICQRSKSMRCLFIVARQGHWGYDCSSFVVGYISYNLKNYIEESNQQILHHLFKNWSFNSVIIFDYFIDTIHIDSELIIKESQLMFLDDLSEENNRGSQGMRPKQSRRQYSAGFKNYHPPKPMLSSATETNRTQEDLFDQLKIGNLRELYEQSIPAQNKKRQQMELQLSSIARMTQLKKKQENVQVDEEEERARKAEEQLKFMVTYQKEQNYKEKANKKLYKGEFQRLRDKLFQISRKNSKSQDFNDLFIPFLLHKNAAYSQKAKIQNDELILDFANYANQVNFGTIKAKEDSTIKIRQFQELIKKNLFIFGYFDASECEERVLDKDQIMKCTRKEGDEQRQFQWSLVEQLLNKKITIPYDVQLYKTTPKEIKIQPQKQNQEDSANNSFKFRAAPIPKTTYQPPKERPKSQMAKTKTEPFNLTTTNAIKLTVEEVYKWDRNVHPQKVPKTTYEPNTIVYASQDQKRKRALELLHSANYPPNMKYLDHYKDAKQQRHGQLEGKHTKVRVGEPMKPIPNFQLIHHRQINELESAKIQKRQLTKPQPFNLSQNRPIKEQPLQHVDLEQEVEGRRVRKDYSQPNVQPHSTLKFDTYVKHLKKQKEQKIEKEERNKKEGIKREEKQKIFKEMLKDRVDCELGKQPKKKLYPTQISSEMIKVNLEKIYGDEPLLMEREGVKSKKYSQSLKKTWEPII